MAKPSTLPKWANTIGTDVNSQPTVIAPNDSKQENGWQYGEKPAYQFFNWLFRTIYLWIFWIDDELDPRVTAAEGDISSLDGRLDTAESDILALDGRVDDIETELLSIPTVKNSINYSKAIGELFTLDFPKATNYTFNPASPRDYWPAINLSSIDVTLTVDNTDIPQASLDHLRAKYLIYLPGKSGEVSQWSVTVSGSDITFPNNTSANATLAALSEDKDVQGTFTNGRTVNIDNIDWAITGINLVTRVVTVSGSPTTGSQTARFYLHRIAGSTTTARLFEVSGESFIAGGDANGYFIAGLRTRGYFQGHRHNVRVRAGFNSDIPSNKVSGQSGAGDNLYTLPEGGDPITDGTNGDPLTRKITHSPAISGIPCQWFPEV